MITRYQPPKKSARQRRSLFGLVSVVRTFFGMASRSLQVMESFRRSDSTAKRRNMKGFNVKRNAIKRWYLGAGSVVAGLFLLAFLAVTGLHATTPERPVEFERVGQWTL